jgi:hypothetical protein
MLALLRRLPRFLSSASPLTRRGKFGSEPCAMFLGISFCDMILLVGNECDCGARIEIIVPWNFRGYSGNGAWTAGYTLCTSDFGTKEGSLGKVRITSNSWKMLPKLRSILVALGGVVVAWGMTSGPRS